MQQHRDHGLCSSIVDGCYLQSAVFRHVIAVVLTLTAALLKFNSPDMLNVTRMRGT